MRRVEVFDILADAKNITFTKDVDLEDVATLMPCATEVQLDSMLAEARSAASHVWLSSVHNHTADKAL